MYESISSSYENIPTRSTYLASSQEPFPFGDAGVDVPATYPSTQEAGPPPRFCFPTEPSKSPEWKLIGYITSSCSTSSVYKLFERYNQDSYMYEHIALIENGIYVQLTSSDNKIRKNSSISNVPGKAGTYQVHLYENTMRCR